MWQGKLRTPSRRGKRNITLGVSLASRVLIIKETFRDAAVKCARKVHGVRRNCGRKRKCTSGAMLRIKWLDVFEKECLRSTI